MKSLRMKNIAEKKGFIKYLRKSEHYFPLGEFGMEKFQKWGTDFLSVSDAMDLATLLRIKRKVLDELINQPNYFSYKIAKKKGGFRQIDAPEEALKKVQRVLNFYLQCLYTPQKKSFVHGFTINTEADEQSCNIYNNALAHIKKKAVLNIDLKDFFSTITSYQVYEVFLKLFGEEKKDIAIACTLLCTYEGRLPTGAPSSPVLSNFVCLALDEQLHAFANKNYLTYTRYADDLSFSSSNRIMDDQVLDIIVIIHQHAFRINEKKLRVQGKHRQQKVTGLVVNEKVNVDRKFYKKTRAMLDLLNKFGPESAARVHFKLSESPSEKQVALFLSRLNGYINFIGQVRGKHDAIYLRMRNELEGAVLL